MKRSLFVTNHGGFVGQQIQLRLMLDASSWELLPAALPVDHKHPQSLVDLRRQLPDVFIQDER